jgi:L-threonylcarbamoyladenylate synthase
VLLRPGHISADRLAQVIGVMPRMPDAAAPRASGTLDSHYAPGTPAALVNATALADTVQQLVAVGQKAAVISRTVPSVPNVATQFALPAAPTGYAHDLYAALRAADAVAADIILIEEPPSTSDWQGVNDRLRRAAHDSLGIIARRLAAASPQAQ